MLGCFLEHGLRQRLEAAVLLGELARLVLIGLEEHGMRPGLGGALGVPVSKPPTRLVALLGHHPALRAGRCDRDSEVARVRFLDGKKLLAGRDTAQGERGQQDGRQTADDAVHDDCPPVTFEPGNFNRNCTPDLWLSWSIMLTLSMAGGAKWADTHS